LITKLYSQSRFSWNALAGNGDVDILYRLEIYIRNLLFQRMI